jgi:hypothetical protein
MLTDIKRFKTIVIKTKLKLYMRELKIMRFVYNVNKRHSN